MRAGRRRCPRPTSTTSAAARIATRSRSPTIWSGRPADLRSAVDGGAAVLAVCGGYQLLGHGYRGHAGDEMPGTGLVDLVTEAGPTRMIGNIAIRLRARRRRAAHRGRLREPRRPHAARRRASSRSAACCTATATTAGRRRGRPRRQGDRHLHPRPAPSEEPVAGRLADRARRWSAGTGPSSSSRSTTRSSSRPTGSPSGSRRGRSASRRRVERSPSHDHASRPARSGPAARSPGAQVEDGGVLKAIRRRIARTLPHASGHTAGAAVRSSTPAYPEAAERRPRPDTICQRSPRSAPQPRADKPKRTKPGDRRGIPPRLPTTLAGSGEAADTPSRGSAQAVEAACRLSRACCDRACRDRASRERRSLPGGRRRVRAPTGARRASRSAVCPFGAGGRAAAAVQPDPADAGGLGALDVALEAVADHHGPVGVHSEELERVREDLPAGLPHAEVPRDHDSVEVVLGEPAPGQLLALEARAPLVTSASACVGPQRLERGASVRERLVPEPALDAEPLAELLGQGAMSTTPWSASAMPPRLARGSPRAHSRHGPHLGAVALPAAPQRLPRAHADRVLAVVVRRPGPPQLARPRYARCARGRPASSRCRPAATSAVARNAAAAAGSSTTSVSSRSKRIAVVMRDTPWGQTPGLGVWPRWFT